ncbi:SMK killer toxin resistance protein [Rhizina undulata]
MSQFISDIWASVFQPGTNSSLVLATHVSFALLQATLFLLLVATYSWHFVFLGAICAGLWAAITWFIREVEEIRRVEMEGERLRKLRKERGETEEESGSESEKDEGREEEHEEHEEEDKKER